jgi:hypothetical protein
MVKKMNNNSTKKTAKIVGVLIILALASSLMSGVFLESVDQENPDYLDAISVNENQVFIGVLLLATLTASVVAIPIVMFPIFKQHNESLALGYVGARIFEGFSDFILAISPLLLVALSQEFVNATAPIASHFETAGALILALRDWVGILENVPYSLGVLMFSYLLYQSKLVPRWSIQTRSSMVSSLGSYRRCNYANKSPYKYVHPCSSIPLSRMDSPFSHSNHSE